MVVVLWRSEWALEPLTRGGGRGDVVCFDRPRGVERERELDAERDGDNHVFVCFFLFLLC